MRTVRILFVNAPLWNETRSITGEAMGGLAFFPPLGMLYLSSYLKTHSKIDIDTRLFDYTFVQKNNYQAIDQMLEDFEPEIVGLTTYTFILYDIYEICAYIKAKRPDCKIVLGGKHVEIYPEEALEQDFVDYVVQGEGEIPFLKLVESISEGNKQPQIEGVWFNKEGELQRAGKAERIRDLNALPFPDLSLIESAGYNYIFNSGKAEGIMSTSRGCPYTCKYCMSAYSERVFAGRSAENVVDEMQLWVDKCVESINLFDHTFNANLKRAKRICQLIINRGIKVRWTFRGTPNCVDEELTQLLAEAGCERAILGVESATKEILVKFGRKSEIETVRNAYSLLDKYGISTAGFFMLGFPGETREMALDTINLACSLPLDYAQFTVLFPAPGTPYLDMIMKDEGFPDLWRDYAKNPDKDFIIPYHENLLSEKEVKKLAQNAYKKFYFRPSLIWRHLRKLSSFSAFKAKFLLALRLLKYSLKKQTVEAVVAKS